MTFVAEDSSSTRQALDSAEMRLGNMLSASMRLGSSSEREFLQAILGKDIRSIGRYQVFTDTTDNERVVFIHDPTGRCDHKYIFAETGDKTFIIAAPVEWTEYHREILARVSAAMGKRAYCPGGGYISVSEQGALWVGRESGDFGRGDHARAEKAFKAAVAKGAN